MTTDDLHKVLAFLQQAENLKNTLRSAHTSAGRQESTAEHSWQLALLVVLLGPAFAGADLAKMLGLAVVHDLAEAITGDIPAICQKADGRKKAGEQAAMESMCALLPTEAGERIVQLWKEYEAATTLEAKLVKGLDKLETICQHNRGKNPENFDYAFNLEYGQAYMQAHPLLAALRGLADAATRERAAGGGHSRERSKTSLPETGPGEPAGK